MFQDSFLNNIEAKMCQAG